ncbi:NAD-binding Rossmann fold oxidoreductase family protein [Penicillium robsamsonii]|uniref:NAD-binding Rossmann fold oxidoreductase family protein n=1 Tax=Penicillium robsamsonii TaxID=1792511 RepID=UPI002546F3D5|nr:NAD-binding Rossmann fold oxidoreductase family protein [Penicillium robsamsonii]KAJ5837189.1 NAD-binding Rossmann fold oxidoreductase family protein [Penicillium robsamsonii]
MQTVREADGSVVKENADKTTLDHIIIQGTLKSGAVLSAAIRGGAPFKRTPGLVWNIYDEQGEIRITGPSAFIGSVGTTSFGLHNFHTDNVEDIELKEGTFAKMGPINRNIARVCEAIAEGGHGVRCDFEDAVKRHEFIREIHDQNLERVSV